ncbi:MarR family winged helix-turn-helix transcriptional regulator [Sulfitobacter geojensis]|uniref:MarR family winged helix-turn-helix transcriptional regulator n=1 Tax=Sulfitobacter geojensis TaxID=1342299 RepID=UPI00046A6946|nr:Transcriptional regulator, MarR family [Sulfitobacter geojensis]NYI29743.1 DNA-binding MarR family transcriptional regulator [Sulfitobacter geojensis]
MIEDDLDYVLDDQIGFLLRLASQRHSVIFQKNVVGKLTATQFATLMRISEHGEVSQNHLGRLAAMDVATIKGVVDRLKAKGLVQTRANPRDKRRMSISLSNAGHQMIGDLKRAGHEISALTLAPLSADESQTLVSLLKKIS